MRGFAWLESHPTVGPRVLALDAHQRRVELFVAPPETRLVSAQLSADGLRLVVAVAPTLDDPPLGRVALVDLRRDRVHWVPAPGPGLWSLEDPQLADTGQHLCLAARRPGLPLADRYCYRLDLQPQSGDLSLTVVAGLALEHGHAPFGPLFLPGGERLVYLRPTEGGSGAEVAALELGREGDSSVGLQTPAPGRLRLWLSQGAQALVTVPPVYSPALKRTFFVAPAPGDRVRVCSFAPGGQPTPFESIYDSIQSLAVDPEGEHVAWSTPEAVFVNRATANLGAAGTPGRVRRVEGPVPTGPLCFVDGRLWYAAGETLYDVGPERGDARAIFEADGALLAVLPLPDDRRMLSRIRALGVPPPDARSDAAVAARADLHGFFAGLEGHALPFERLALLAELHGDATATERVVEHLETQRLRARLDGRAHDGLVFALVAAAHLCAGAEVLAGLCQEAAAQLEDDGALPDAARFLALRVVELAAVERADSASAPLPALGDAPEASGAEAGASGGERGAEPVLPPEVSDAAEPLLRWVAAARTFEPTAIFAELAALQARRATALSHDDGPALDALRQGLSGRFRAASARARRLVAGQAPQATTEANDAETARRFQADRQAVQHRLEGLEAERRAQQARAAAAREAAERATRKREYEARRAVERAAAEAAAAEAAATAAAAAAAVEAEVRRRKESAEAEDQRAAIERLAAEAARRAEGEKLVAAAERRLETEAAAERRRHTAELPVPGADLLADILARAGDGPGPAPSGPGHTSAPPAPATELLSAERTLPLDPDDHPPGDAASHLRRDLSNLRVELQSARVAVNAERAAREAAEESARQAAVAETRALAAAEAERDQAQAQTLRARAEAEAERAHRVAAESERDAVRTRLEEEVAARHAAVSAAERRAEQLRAALDAERESRAVVESELAAAHEAAHAAAEAAAQAAAQERSRPAAPVPPASTPPASAPPAEVGPAHLTPPPDPGVAGAAAQPHTAPEAAHTPGADWPAAALDPTAGLDPAGALAPSTASVGRARALLAVALGAGGGAALTAGVVSLGDAAGALTGGAALVIGALFAVFGAQRRSDAPPDDSADR